MKFLLDANIPYSAKEVFPKKYQVFHVRDLDLTTMPDEKVIGWAKKNGAALVSRDLDFANILNFPPERYHGIIIMRIPYFYTSKEIKRVLKNFIENIKESQISKSTIIVEEGRFRIKNPSSQQ